MSLLSALELYKRLQSGEKFTADGAIGTELMRQGIAPEDILQTNRVNPTLVRSLHQSYLDAGSDIITANTFGMPGSLNWANDLRIGAQIALTMCSDSNRFVSAWTSFIPHVLTDRIKEIRSVFRDLSPQPSIVLLETCTSLREALDAIDAVAKLAPTLLCVTCHFTVLGRMLDGTSSAEAAQRLVAAGASVVGANCGDCPDIYKELLVAMKQSVEVPLLFQPNAGLPFRVEGSEPVKYPVSPARFTEIGRSLFNAGAGIIGGCCGTTPAHISALKVH